MSRPPVTFWTLPGKKLNAWAKTLKRLTNLDVILQHFESENLPLIEDDDYSYVSLKTGPNITVIRSLIRAVIGVVGSEHMMDKAWLEVVLYPATQAAHPHNRAFVRITHLSTSLHNTELAIAFFSNFYGSRDY